MKTSSDEECLGLGMTLLYDLDLREEDIDEVLQRILTEHGLTLSQVHLSYWETHHEEPGIKIFKLKDAQPAKPKKREPEPIFRPSRMQRKSF